MERIVKHHWHDFGQIKGDHGAIYAEARRQLGHRRRQHCPGEHLGQPQR